MQLRIICHLYELRISKDLTIRQLATLSGVSKTTINSLENGNINSTLFSICAIAAALGVTLDALVSFDIK